MNSPIPSHENTPSPAEPAQDNSSGGTAGSIIGIIIIVVVLALGGFYFWGKRATEKETPTEFPDTSLLTPVPGSSVPEMIVEEEENTNNTN